MKIIELKEIIDKLIESNENSLDSEVGITFIEQSGTKKIAKEGFISGSELNIEECFLHLIARENKDDYQY